MILGPFNLLFTFLMTLLSLSILGGGIYLVWGWYEGVLVGISFLVSGIAMLVISFLGAPLMMLILGSKHPAAKPQKAPEGKPHRIALADGTEIYVEQFGAENGPALIFTHGLSMNGTAWNYVKQFSSSHRIFIWDVPGFGHSQSPIKLPYTMETLAASLHEVVKLTGDGPVVLAGHSMGGMITLTYCRLYSEELTSRITGLILAHTSYTNPVKTAKFHPLLTALQKPLLEPLCHLMIWLKPVVWLMNIQNYISGMAHLNCHLTGYAGKETPAQLDFAAHYSLVSSPAATGRAMLAMFKYDATDILPLISVPTLVVTGNHDLVTLPEAGEKIHLSIPGATRVELAPSGHLGMIEQYEPFLQNVDAWMSNKQSNASLPAAAKMSFPNNAVRVSG